jgi:hypothetical protein
MYTYSLQLSQQILEEFFMCGDGKESYRVPAVMYSEEVIQYIESVCNGCQSHPECEIAKSFSVLDRCENFKGKEMPMIRDDLHQSVFVFPSTPLYVSLAQEFPEERFHS